MASSSTVPRRATLQVTTDLPWLVRGWCRLLIIPLLRVDDDAHQIAWGSPRATSRVEVEPGQHRIQFKARFRGRRNFGASSTPLEIRLEDGENIDLLAQVPAVNGHPPTLSLWAPTAPLHH